MTCGRWLFFLSVSSFLAFIFGFGVESLNLLLFVLVPVRPIWSMVVSWSVQCSVQLITWSAFRISESEARHSHSQPLRHGVCHDAKCCSFFSVLNALFLVFPCYDIMCNCYKNFGDTESLCQHSCEDIWG